MKDLLISILEPLGFPIFQQGSLNKDEAYPDSFFTFWNNDSNNSSYYDNKEHNTIWDFDLNFYSNDPALVSTKLLEAIEKLKTKNFIANGKGYDVASDVITHTGRGINIIKNEKEEL